MTRGAWLRWASRFNRYTVRGLLWIAAIVGVAAGVNVLGIGLVGDVRGWSQWLQAHAGAFRVWRLCLYAGTAYAWYRMHRRLRHREPSPETRRRLIRIELAAVLALVVMESSALLRQG
ncbi:hypothetical protein [Paraburkholderia aspalathi]|uniref:Uncharacterized protein n=1 Tax=Paraburkholderia aspalathi TaxID=1324617 RepID=A0A1I7ABX2_9BURK|nr:hypothetical protein [Paraburkholderia aspalathi]SFT72447.1 hypothetical protein SAMN05192563_1003251 [Paraburkholderia aspalathi]